jgi:hypothetical protein
MQVTTVLTWKAYVEKKLRTSEINANIKQTSWILWKKRGKTKLLLSHCLCLSFTCSWASHPGHILLQSHISRYILVMSLGAICICVFFLIPCQHVTEVVALNNTWLCHSIHCMDQQWGFSKLYYQHKRMEKILRGHASTSTLCFWCKYTKSLRKKQYDYCM